MTKLESTWNRLVEELERKRDELRLKAHLGKAEAKDLLAALEEKLHELRVHAGSTADRAKEAAHHGEERLRKIAAEVRELMLKIQEIT